MTTALAAATALLGACEPSAVPDGDHAALRYLLPDDYAEVMEGADRLTVRALDSVAGAPPSACGDRLGAPIVGQVYEREPAQIRLAAQDVYAAVLDAGGSSLCFEPELAMEFERDGRSVEVLLSEDCHTAWVLVDGRTHRSSLGPTLAITHLRRPLWPSTAGELRRRCGRPPSPTDLSRAPREDGQYHDGILEEGICCEPTM